AFGDALAFQNTIGRAMIEQRSRHLAQALMEGLRKLNGVQVWTSTDPARSAAVVSFRPASLDARKLNAALYENDQIACATRGGTDRPGLRFSPHIYNTMEEVDRTVAAIKRYVAAGV
ncbi:MAG: aminotransferase class V-fold PLP-dependent enzyme, partial [Acidobacteria bacterium]|nr:aminotransferase class V-fold PLP-dependent enzyme [Acidobacteriota bacterium]